MASRGTVPVPGSQTPVDLRAQDPHGAYGRSTLRLDAGRYPHGTDEVAVTVGLIRGRTLTAAGARSRTRRALTASLAGALGLLGATLGTALPAAAGPAGSRRAARYTARPRPLGLLPRRPVKPCQSF